MSQIPVRRPFRTSGLAFTASALAMFQSAVSIGAPPAPVSGLVPADYPAGITAPLAVPCHDASADSGTLLARVKVGSGEERSVPAQYEPADAVAGTPARIWLAWEAPKAPGGRQIHIAWASAEDRGGSAAAKRSSTKRDDAQVHVVGPDNRPILSYWHGEPAKNQRYPLTDFIHPVFGPDGEVLTARSPRDHVHHRGIFWSWVRHTRDGKSLGTWWIPDTIHLTPGDLATADGPVFARFAALHDWVYQPKGSAETTAILREQVVCRVFHSLPEGRAIDFDITLSALVDGLSLGGTTELNKGYGGFTVRYGPVTDPKAVQVVVDGKALEFGKDVIQGRARWADWSGTFKMPDGTPAPKRSGAAVFVHPGHPDYPPEWLTRFYGVLNVSYPGLKMLDVPKERPLRLSYRLWIHRGNADEGAVARHHGAYAALIRWTTAPTAAGEDK